MAEQDLEIIDVPHGEIIDMNDKSESISQKMVCSSKKKKHFLWTLLLFFTILIAGTLWSKQK